MPHKVLHITTSTHTGGAEKQLLRLMESSDPALFSHEVVCLGPKGPIGEEMERAGLGVFYLDLSPSLGDLPGGVAGLLRLKKTIKPDLLQCWMYHANLLGLAPAFLGKRLPVLWGIFCTDMDLSKYSLGTRLVVAASRMTSGWPEKIVCNSQRSIDYHAALGFKKDRFQLLYNGFDTQLFRPRPQAGRRIREELGFTSEQVLIGKVARFDPMKDHKSLVMAAAQVIKDFPQARFVLIGREMHHVLAIFQENGLDHLRDCFCLAGERHDIPEFLSALDLHVSCSSFGEGFSNAVGEAMAAGLPNVVTQVGDNDHLVGDTGYVIPPKDPTRLAQALKTFLALSEEARKELGSRARRRIQEEFSIPAMVEAYQRLYLDLLPEKPAAA